MKQVSELIQKANEAVIDAMAKYDVTMRTYEDAHLAKETAYVHLVRVRENLEDALRIEAGLPPVNVMGVRNAQGAFVGSAPRVELDLGQTA